MDAEAIPEQTRFAHTLMFRRGPSFEMKLGGAGASVSTSGHGLRCNFLTQHRAPGSIPLVHLR